MVANNSRINFQMFQSNKIEKKHHNTALIDIQLIVKTVRVQSQLINSSNTIQREIKWRFKHSQQLNIRRINKMMRTALIQKHFQSISTSANHNFGCHKHFAIFTNSQFTFFSSKFWKFKFRQYWISQVAKKIINWM